MSVKKRLTVTVDPGLVAAGQHAVETGAAGSVSEWVSTALEEKVRNDRKLAMLAEAVAAFEAEYGEISAAEMAAQARHDRQRATVVRGSGPDSSGAAHTPAAEPA